MAREIHKVAKENGMEKKTQLKQVTLTYQEWMESLKMPTPVRNKKKYTRKAKHINKRYE